MAGLTIFLGIHPVVCVPDDITILNFGFFFFVIFVIFVFRFRFLVFVFVFFLLFSYGLLF